MYYKCATLNSPSFRRAASNGPYAEAVPSFDGLSPLVRLGGTRLIFVAVSLRCQGENFVCDDLRLCANTRRGAQKGTRGIRLKSVRRADLYLRVQRVRSRVNDEKKKGEKKSTHSFRHSSNGNTF